MEVKHCTEEGIHVFCPGEGCFGFIPREEIIWGIVDSACSLYDEGERLWVCHLDYDAARGLCRFSRRRLLAGAAVPFVAGARLSARITRITEKLMVVKCNDTEASVLLGDTTWTPPFRLGERYLPTRYAAAERSRPWSNDWRRAEFRGSASAGCNPIRGFTARCRTTIRSSPK